MRVKWGPPIDDGVVLVTGASAGIGREFARQLAPRAAALALVARRADRLEELRAELLRRSPALAIHLYPCDLADPAAADAMAAAALRELGAVDVLVNNAGLGDQTLYERADWGRVNQIIQVNVVAVALLTHRLLPGMVGRRRGGILNVNSGAGVAIMPGAAAYTASKHFVTGFTEALRAELDGTGVVVSQVLPGPVETEFDRVAGIEGMAGGPPQALRISAERCVRETVRGFDRGEAMIFPGFAYRQLMRAQALAPRGLQRRAGRAVARKLRAASPPARTPRA